MIRRLPLLLLLACSNDDAASTSGVAGDAALSALSAQELDTVCHWIVDEEYKLDAKTECLPGAVYRTENRTDCEAELATCSAEHPADLERRRASMIANCGEYVIEEECKATVAQLEACVRDRFDAVRKFAGTLSCARTMPDEGASDEQVNPKSCAIVPRGCFP